MGNILCKNRANRNVNNGTRNPVDRMCPSGVGKKKHFWEKQILETSPATSNSNNNQLLASNKDEWDSPTLTVPLNNIENDKNKQQKPVAPPRKKRQPSMLVKQDDGHVNNKSSSSSIIKNGFDDVFATHQQYIDDIHTTPILLSSTIIDHNDDDHHHQQQQQQPQQSMKSDNKNIDNLKKIIDGGKLVNTTTTTTTTKTTLTRKVSPVGNKKSDKFFGENLSDYLSDELIPTDNHKQNDDVNRKNNNDNAVLKYHLDENPKIVVEDLTIIETTTSDDPNQPINEKLSISKSETVETVGTDGTDGTENILKDLPEIPSTRVFTTNSINLKSDHDHDHDQSSTNDENNIESIINVDGIIEEELLRNINKEKGKFMFAIEKHIKETQSVVENNDDDQYKNQQPVEEELIIPIVKKIRRHICDDDEHIHQKLNIHSSSHKSHQHHDHDHNHNHDNVIQGIVTGTGTGATLINDNHNALAPKKPQRDFAKYRKSLDRKDIIETSQIINGMNQNNADDFTVNTTELIVNNLIKNQPKNDLITEQIKQEAEITVDEILQSAQNLVADKLQLKEQNQIESIHKEQQNFVVDDTVIIPTTTTTSIPKLSTDNNSNMELLVMKPIATPANENKVIQTEQTEIINQKVPVKDDDHADDLLQKESNKDNLEVNSITPARPQRSSEIVPPNLSNSEKILRRCLSTQSYLSSDLIEKIALQANILSMPESFVPEDALRCNDGSGLVSPNFKLEQKRSFNSQLSYTSDKNDNQLPSTTTTDAAPAAAADDDDDSMTTLENENFLVIEKLLNANPTIPLPIENIQTNSNVSTESNHKLPIIEQKQSSIQNTIEINDLPKNKIEKQNTNRLISRLSSTNNNNNNEKTSADMKICNNDMKKQISDTIKNFLNKKDLKPEEILELLDYEFGDYMCAINLSNEDKLIINDLENAVKNNEKFNDNLITPTQEKSSIQFPNINNNNNHKEIDDKNVKILTTPIQNNQHYHHQQQHKSLSDKHNNKISKIPIFKNKSTEQLTGYHDKRRHSIDDLNAWFTPEKDFPIRKRKREASLPGCLNTPPESFNNNSKLRESAIPTKKTVLPMIEQHQIINDVHVNDRSIHNMVDSILNSAENVINSTNKTPVVTGSLLMSKNNDDIQSFKKKNHNIHHHHHHQKNKNIKKNQEPASKDSKLLLAPSVNKLPNVNNDSVSDQEEDDHSALLKFLEHEKMNN